MIVIQKNFRRMVARRKVAEMRHDCELSIQWEEQEKVRKEREKQERHQHDYERRVHPKTKTDFDLIFSALESKYFIFGLLTVSGHYCMFRHRGELTHMLQGNFRPVFLLVINS